MTEAIANPAQRMRTRRLLGLTLLAAGALLTAVFSMTVGSVPIPATDVLSALAGTARDTATHQVVWELRLPRTLAGFATGAALGLAGAKMQVLIRNPLADPYVLGISGGAAVFALLAMILGAAHGVMQLAAGGGAILSMLIVLGLGRGRGQWSSTRLLLTGVVVAAGWGAMVSFLLAIGPTQQLKGMLFWLMGDLSLAEPGLVLPAVLLIAVALGIGLARSMNLLASGELRAASLGVDVGKLRLALYLSASLLTAAAVTVAGSIGFVGLVVPHMMRLLGGADHRWVVPASAFAGGAMVVLADALARTVLAPQQLPVGVLTAFAGVPLFLWLLWRGGRGRVSE